MQNRARAILKHPEGSRGARKLSGRTPAPFERRALARAALFAGGGLGAAALSAVRVRKAAAAPLERRALARAALFAGGRLGSCCTVNCESS